MEEDMKHYKLGNTIQEFEEMFGNVPFNDIEKIKKNRKKVIYVKLLNSPNLFL